MGTQIVRSCILNKNIEKHRRQSGKKVNFLEILQKYKHKQKNNDSMETKSTNNILNIPDD